MADKRLKDTDEILSSLGKRSGNRQAPSLPDLAQQAEDSGEARETLISSPLDDRPSTRRRRRSRVSTVLQEEGGGPEDRNPLDMSKYQLPQRGPAEEAPPEEFAEPAPAKKATRAAPSRSKAGTKKGTAASPEAKKETAAQKAQREEEERAFSLDALDEEFEIQLELPPKPSLRKKTKSAAAQQPEKPAPRESRKQSKEEPVQQPAPPQPVKEILEYHFETLGPEPQQPEEENNEGYMVLDTQEAEELLGRMEGDNEAPLHEMDRETEAFFQNFEQQVQQEEAVRSQSFQDTLAEKFNRERARYLKELGIPAEQDLPPEQEVPQRRILDLKIQPEMHMQPGEDAPPVTYGPGGDVRPMDKEEEPPLPPRRPPAKVVDAASLAKQGGNGKKSSEELLLELAAQNQVRAIRGQGTAKAAKKKNAVAARRMAAAAGEAPGGAKPNTLRTVLLSTAAALVVVALIVVPLVFLLTRDKGIVESSLPEYAQGGGTLTAYESYEFDTVHRVPDVMIKKSGITLRGIQVDTHVVISDTETRGAVTLRDMEVGGSIYVQNCAVDTLLLDNVTADRVIVGNASSRVTVQLAGSTAINTVELRTPSTVTQQMLEAGNNGTSNILVKKADEVDTLDVTLEGLELQSLVVGGGGVITLSGGSAVDSIAADGNLVLGGEGSVASLSASAETAPAGERLSLQLRGVPVANLSVKSPADLNLGTRVGNLATSDSLTISGGGEVDTLVLNSRFDSDRVSLEFSGSTVHTLISNAQSRVSVDGDAQVNTLTANASVYTTGNKLNHLMVNADDVIYEIQPDKITVTPGIRPPESTADNPNLDLEASAAATDGGPLVDVSGDPVATTCSHTRESGGFVRGDGSRTNPFEVATPAQLAHVSEHLTSHFRQTGDIDISDDSQFASGFPMIASGGSAFQGSYDGGGFFIANLRIASQAENVGLFAENVGEIRNVHVVSGEVQSTASTRTYAGGIVGLNYENGLVSSCSNGAKVVGSGSGYAGGLVGYNYKARVLDCYNYAKITGNGNVGGIVGVNRESASVAGSYNAGTIEANVDTGAVVGVNEGASVTNCYFLADTAEEGIGKGTGNVVEKTTQELSAAQMAMDLAGGNADSLWTMPSSGSYTYPVLEAPPTPVVEEAPASSAESSGEESSSDVAEVG